MVTVYDLVKETGDHQTPFGPREKQIVIHVDLVRNPGR